MESSLEHMSSQYDSLLKAIEAQKEDIKTLQTTTVNLGTKSESLADEVAQMKLTIESLEEYSRRSNIEIHGIPQSNNENLRDVLNNCADKFGLTKPMDGQLEAIHRIRARAGATPPILVRFSNRSIRDTWLAKRLQLKSDKIFINENLTSYVKKLLWMAKNAAREKAYKFVWVKNGKVFARKQEGAGVIRIENEASIAKMT